MNSPFFKRKLPIAAMFVIIFVLSLLPHLDSMVASSRYSECAELAKTDPKGALEVAKDWRKDYPDSLLGKHCEAVALFATHDYAHAGDRFMDLGKLASNNSPMLAARLFMQASTAYTAAGKVDEAKQAEAAALIVRPQSSRSPDKPADKPADKPDEITFRPSEGTGSGAAK